MKFFILIKRQRKKVIFALTRYKNDVGNILIEILNALLTFYEDLKFELRNNQKKMNALKEETETKDRLVESMRARLEKTERSFQLASLNPNQQKFKVEDKKANLKQGGEDFFCDRNHNDNVFGDNVLF